MKHVLKGFLEGLGIAAASALSSLLLLLLPGVRAWASRVAGGREDAGSISATIFLIVLCAVLLVLLVWSRISYIGLLRRVREGKLTLGDLMSMKDMMKATDIEALIQKRRGSLKGDKHDT